MPDIAVAEQQLARKRDRAQRQQLGQFFTPEPLARYLADAVMEIEPRTVLDPAVGAGRLLQALPARVQKFGLDVDPEATALAGEALADAQIATGDFLDQEHWPLGEQTFDAIVANPPYVRHHRLTAGQKEQRHALGVETGIDISSLSDYYVYFFFEAMRRLNDGGRLAFVTPAQFLDSGYGRAVKRLLCEYGSIDRIVVFGDHHGVFGDARTTAAVTIVTKGKSKKHVAFHDAAFNGKVDHLSLRKVDPKLLVPDEQWSHHLPSRVQVASTAKTVRLDEIIRIRRGLATGSNEFFCFTEAERRRLGIPEGYVVPLLARGRNMPSKTFTDADWQKRRDDGERVWLLWLPDKRIQSKSVQEHLARGEAEGVNLRTMCNRNASQPWYVVENVDAPDYFFTYMAKSPLRFVENKANVRALTALLCGWLQRGVDPEWAKTILCSNATSDAITKAAQDRGNGLFKIEPGRLREVRVPTSI